MAERGSGGAGGSGGGSRGGSHGAGGAGAGPGGGEGETEAADLDRLRLRIDDVDRRIVALLNERATLARAVGRAKLDLGRKAIRDHDREREVLLRVAMASDGPLPQADLVAIYKRVIAAMRGLEAADRRRGHGAAGAAGGAGSPGDGTD